MGNTTGRVTKTELLMNELCATKIELTSRINIERVARQNETASAPWRLWNRPTRAQPIFYETTIESILRKSISRARNPIIRVEGHWKCYWVRESTVITSRATLVNEAILLVLFLTRYFSPSTNFSSTSTLVWLLAQWINRFHFKKIWRRV